ncbi:hypothetical protein V8D89_005322 [Ganoderma adspersum]
MRHIELLRLHAKFRRGRGASSWADVVLVLQLFTTVSSTRRLRLCYWAGFCVPSKDKRLYKLFWELDPVLEDGTFRSLEAVELASFVVEQDEALPGVHDQPPASLKRKPPKLHKRVVVRVYVHN